MAFMMPVVKDNYDIYPASRPSRRSSSVSIPRSRTSTLNDSNIPSLSSSPGSDFEAIIEERLRSASELPSRSRNISQCTYDSDCPSPKPASQFHGRVVNKLKKTLRIKDNLGQSSSAREQDSNPTTKTLDSSA